MAVPASQTLFDEAACYSCLGAVSAAQTMRIALLTQISDALISGMTPQELIDEGQCYLCIPGVSLADTVELALLANISDNIGGGGSGTGGAGIVGVVDPEGVVSAPPGTLYVNTANGTLWIKQSGSGSVGWQQFI